MLGEMLDCCRQCSQKDAVSAFNSLQDYILPPTASPSRTLYLLEVLSVLLLYNYGDNDNCSFLYCRWLIPC